MWGTDRSHEGVVNDGLARVMRGRLGLDAVAEILDSGERRLGGILAFA